MKTAFGYGDSMAKPIAKEWTESRVKSFITSTLRAGSRRWPPKYECLKKAYKETKINVSSGRLAKHFQCKKCKELFTSTNVTVDHIKPIVGPEGFISWDLFIERLFCPIENLQCLCKPCHSIKTKKETLKRTKTNGTRKTKTL